MTRQELTGERQRPFGPRSESDPRYVAGWRAGYAEGFTDGAAAQPDRELYTFVEVPWSAIRAEDTIKGEDGGHYHVVRSGAMPRSPVRTGGAAVDDSGPPGWIVTLVCGTYRDVTCLDHDHRVSVLVPVGLADALIVSHAGLPGSRLIATRADPGDRADGPTFSGEDPWRVEVTGRATTDGG